MNGRHVTLKGDRRAEQEEINRKTDSAEIPHKSFVVLWLIGIKYLRDPGRVINHNM